MGEIPWAAGRSVAAACALADLAGLTCGNTGENITLSIHMSTLLVLDVLPFGDLI